MLFRVVIPRHHVHCYNLNTLFELLFSLLKQNFLQAFQKRLEPVTSRLHLCFFRKWNHYLSCFGTQRLRLGVRGLPDIQWTITPKENLSLKSKCLFWIIIRLSMIVRVGVILTEIGTSTGIGLFSFGLGSSFA